MYYTLLRTKTITLPYYRTMLIDEIEEFDRFGCYPDLLFN